MKARLAKYEDGKVAAAFPLPEPGTTIGRAEENFIRLNDPQVSRYHAEVHAKDNMWLIKDRDSTNGLVVNGQRVPHAVLKNGDKIAIGPFELVFETITDAEQWQQPAGTAVSQDARNKTIVHKPGPQGPATLPF